MEPKPRRFSITSFLRPSTAGGNSSTPRPESSFDIDPAAYQDSPIFTPPADFDPDRRSSDPGMDWVRQAAGRRDSVAELISSSAPLNTRRASVPPEGEERKGRSKRSPKEKKELKKEKEKEGEGKAMKSPKEKKKGKKPEQEVEIKIERAESMVLPLARREAAVGQAKEAPSHTKLSPETRRARSRSLSAIPEVAEEMQRRSSSRELDAVVEVENSLLLVWDDMPERQKKRHLVINEIVSTERDYVSDLQVLLSVFMAPMQSQGVVTAEEARRLFSNSKTLMAINQALLADLETRLIASQGNSLGECFLNFGDYLRMYVIYCSNQHTAYKTLARCEKTNAQFREFLKQAHANAQTNLLHLDSYLIKPLQRLCKYPLLLRELINVTPEDHKDYERLNRALDKIKKVVASVNDSNELEEELEAMAKVIEQLQGTERFGVPLVVPGRKYFQEGVLQKIVQDRKESVSLHYFLFSDLLILTTSPTTLKGSGSKSKINAIAKVDVKLMLPLLDAQVRLNSSSDDDYVADEARANAIKVVRGRKEYVVSFASAEQKRSWTECYLAAVAHRTASPLSSSSG